ncbi:MAG: hypothetical protein HXX20_23335 [Chloroflexi bacterium]|nr:hypothetical protein [Chloroflexota bacterium]
MTEGISGSTATPPKSTPQIPVIVTSSSDQPRPSQPSSVSGSQRAVQNQGNEQFSATPELSTPTSVTSSSPLITPATNNPVVAENKQPGTDQWQFELRGLIEQADISSQIKGYTSATSINKGESIDFHISVFPNQNYSLEVYRMGWYNGKGARLMHKAGPLPGTQQPKCPIDPITGLTECNWAVSYHLPIPQDWTSGIYEVLLINQNNYASYMVFVVRDDTRVADLIYQQSITAYQAYNDYPDNMGKSLYDTSLGANTLAKTPRAVKVSFDRPYSGSGLSEFIMWDVYYVRWLERMGYDVVYSTGLDTHLNGQRLLNYKGIFIAGHDEYWSKQMRDAVENARDRGVNLGFFGANDAYWQVRFEPSSSGVPNRIMVCYKDIKFDPIQDETATVRFRDPPVNRPEQTLQGIQYGIWSEQIYTPYIVKNSQHWIYEGSGLKDGDSIPGIVGYEIDYFMPEYGQAAARSNTWAFLSSSPFVSHEKVTANATTSIFQAPSGAWVFSTGTLGWAWALDNFGKHTVANNGIQKATQNILDKFISNTR